MNLALPRYSLRLNKLSVIYLFSFLFSIILNNLLNKLSAAIYLGKFSLIDFLLHPHIIGSYCSANTAESAMTRFYIFLAAKIVFMLAAFLIYRLAKAEKVKRITAEGVTLFLIFDLLFVLLYPFSGLLDFGIQQYFFSAFPQYLTTYVGLPPFLAPLFWAIVLLLFLLLTKRINHKQLLQRLGLSTFSFLAITSLFLLSVPLLKELARFAFKLLTILRYIL